MRAFFLRAFQGCLDRLPLGKGEKGQAHINETLWGRTCVSAPRNLLKQPTYGSTLSGFWPSAGLMGWARGGHRDPPLQNASRQGAIGPSQRNASRQGVTGPTPQNLVRLGAIGATVEGFFTRRGSGFRFFEKHVPGAFSTCCSCDSVPVPPS